MTIIPPHLLRSKGLLFGSYQIKAILNLQEQPKCRLSSFPFSNVSYRHTHFFYNIEWILPDSGLTVQYLYVWSLLKLSIDCSNLSSTTFSTMGLNKIKHMWKLKKGGGGGITLVKLAEGDGATEGDLSLIL